jgi:serine/threonine protein kinase
VNPGPRPSDTPLPGALHLPAGPGREGLTFLGPPERLGELGRFGPYPVLGELGHGGMGNVFLAEDPRLGRRVALKVMRPSLAANPVARQRFLREARAVAGLAHDNVVAVFHAGEEGGLPYLLMPVLRGETLEARLRREGRLPPDAVARLAREVAEGLRHAHEHGLVHRDVKPGNVWVEAGTGRAKLLDFGLVRVAEEPGALTRPGALLGTPSYMAPEQIEPASAAAVDHRCDLFALGCVLYQSCTGRVPFQGEGIGATFRAVLNHEPRPPRSLNAEVPEALSDLIVRLLAKDPRLRPASAAAVLDALGVGVAAAPATKPAPPRRPRPWWPVALVPLLSLLALPALWTGASPQPERGTLIIESGDGGAPVTFRGEWTRVLDPCTNREFELRACEAEIQVKELPDGVPFFTRQFVLRQGGKAIVDVRFEPAKRRP